MPPRAKQAKIPKTAKKLQKQPQFEKGFEADEAPEFEEEFEWEKEPEI